MQATPTTIPLPSGKQVSGLWNGPPKPNAYFVLAHGAGAGMTYPFMTELAEALCARDIAVLRYQFPYMEAGRKMPDREPVLTQTVTAALQVGAKAAGSAPLFAGGRSMGGRMTALAMSKGLTSDLKLNVHGLVYLGFPLHPAGKPSTDRAIALAGLTLPQLFIQGTRDELAYFDLMKPLVASLGNAAQMHVIDDGDHSFKVRKSSGSTTALAMQGLIAAVADFILSK